jgi:hypothetical protein
MTPAEAFGLGYLEKLAEAGWLSDEKAQAHARKHAGKMHLTPEQYFDASRAMRDRREELRQVPDKKVKGAMIYWDSKTGEKVILTPQGEIVSFYSAGGSP